MADVFEQRKKFGRAFVEFEPRKIIGLYKTSFSAAFFVEELFGDFGVIRKSAVHYDKSGRSCGTAEVVFERHEDAMKACRQYNGVLLDGRPMNMQLLAPVEDVSSTAERNFSNARRPRRFFSRGRESTFRKNRGRPNQRDNKPLPTAAQLDADLDNYRAKKNTSLMTFN